MADLTTNINLFQPTGFKVIIDKKKFGNLEFFAQSFTHPSTTLSAVEVPFSRITGIPVPGDAITFGEVIISVLLDEDFNAYTEMFNWLNDAVQTNFTTQTDRTTSKYPTFSDMRIVALTSHNNKNKTFKYIDAFPTSVGDITFEATNAGVEYITFMTTFRFSYFEIE